MASPITSRLASNFSAGSKQHPFSASTYLGSLFTSAARTYASSRGPSIKRTKGRGHRDRFAREYAQQRRDANIARQGLLQEQRKKAMGDPIRGIPTPFVQSFTTPVPQGIRSTTESPANKPQSSDPSQPPSPPAYTENEDYLNHYLTKRELNEALDYSRNLSTPPKPSDGTDVDPTVEAEQAEKRASRDASATEAMNRIISLAHASGRDRSQVNVRRIIDKLGRHNTDDSLRPKVTSSAVQDAHGLLEEPTPRAGPDTGSSEVQIGILTAKIQTLADRYEGMSRNDKTNKRNLRLLLHRRQKLLKYMERKERGSERWKFMLETLGLTEATWKGEIAVQ